MGCLILLSLLWLFKDEGGAELEPNVIAATSYQRFRVRGVPGERAIRHDYSEDVELKMRVEENPEITEAIGQFWRGLLS
jgi:hypothetical protein